MKLQVALSVLVFMVLAPDLSLAQTSARPKSKWGQLLQTAQQAVKDGRPDTGEDIALTAYQSAKSSPYLDAQRYSLIVLAQIQTQNRNFEGAKASYDELISLAKRTPYSKFEEAKAYLGLSELQVAQNDLSSAERTLRKASLLIQQDKPLDNQQDPNYQRVLAHWYLMKAQVANYQGKTRQAGRFAELGRAAYQNSL